MSETTIDIPEPLLSEAKAVAAREGTTSAHSSRPACERSWRGGRGEGERFELRDASVDGNGLQPEFRDAGWERMRDAAYDGRGA